MRLFQPSYLLAALLLFTWSAKAQTFSIKGTVTDTLNSNKLQYASVVLMRSADSVMATFTRSKQDGSFELKPVKEGAYLIMISFPSFADYIDIVSVSKDKPVIDMGTIPMVSKSHLLSEFVFKQQIGAIKIKGDTTEYMADSFKVRDNATVEELLRKLPGLQVNKNGEVTAQGEKVKKILVDGEEFFTDDPAVVTKSLQAKAVESVQVYDAKSDEAIFTGVDDGSREKTINLKLKDNMKRGYFGKLVAGGGTDQMYENQGMINVFKGKRKLSAFGIASNTGKIGLGWEDNDKFGGSSGSNTEVTDDGSIISYYQGDDDMGWGGKYNGQGIPSAYTGGVHFSNKWLEDKLHLSGNYRYAKQDIDAINNTLTELSYIDSAGNAKQQFNNQYGESFSTGQRHKVDAIYEWKTDSTSELRVKAGVGSYNKRTTSSSFEESYIDEEKKYERTGSDFSDVTNQNFTASLNWRKKFKKQGRNLSINFDGNYNESDRDGITINNTDYFDSLGNFTDAIDFDQKKDIYSKRTQMKGRFSYTEPLTKIMFLEMNYSASLNNNVSDNLTHDKDPNTEGYSDVINNRFSSKYEFDVLTHTGGSNLRFVTKNYNLSFGGSMSNTQFSQRDRLLNTNNSDRNFTNFFPQASASYRRPGKQMSVRLSYNGSTQQPSIEQIQPLQQNTDPNNISIGNPDLRQEFNHRINVNYNDYKVLSGTYSYFGGGFSIVNDDISRSETIDTNGRRQYQYINVDGNYNGYFWGGYGVNIRKWDTRIGMNFNANFNKVNNVINGQKNLSNNNSYSIGFNINHDKEKKYSFYYGPDITYNQNTSTVNSKVSSYWTVQNDFIASVELPLKFEIGTEVNWYVRQNIGDFDNNNSVFLWNGYVSKKLFKGDQLEVRAYVNDILNQNLGFQRYANGNLLTEQNYNTIRRYGMLQLTWNFTKTGASAPSAAEDANVIIEKQ